MGGLTTSLELQAELTFEASMIVSTNFEILQVHTPNVGRVIHSPILNLPMLKFLMGGCPLFHFPSPPQTTSNIAQVAKRAILHERSVKTSNLEKSLASIDHRVAAVRTARR